MSVDLGWNCHMPRNTFAEQEVLGNRLLDAVMTDGHAAYPAGSLLLRLAGEEAPPQWIGPGPGYRFARALLWMKEASDRPGSGGTLGSLLQRSSASWLDRNGLSTMGMTDFVKQAFVLAEADLRVLQTPQLKDGEVLEDKMQALLRQLKTKAKHWQARRVALRERTPSPGLSASRPRLLAADTQEGVATTATARAMATPEGQAELLARYSLKILGCSMALDFHDLLSLKQPLLRAWEPLTLVEDDSVAAQAAWLLQRVDALLTRENTRDNGLLKRRARSQLAVFDPWSLTDAYDLATVQDLWSKLEDQSGRSSSLPLTLEDVWRISRWVLRQLTDPIHCAQGQWLKRELELLKAFTHESRGRRKGRDGTALAVLSPLRKLLHDHAQWVQTVLEAR